MNLSTLMYRCSGFIAPLTDWPDPDRQALIAGADAVAAAIAQVTDLHEEAAFARTFGNVRYYLSGSLAFPGYAEGNRVSFRPGAATPQLVAHELGHNYLIHHLAQVLPARRELAKVNDAVFVSGTRSCLDKYPRCARFAEKFADAFQAWVFGTFAQNGAGLAWYGWMWQHMSGWLKEEL